jgi:ligand-binding sensor domain-containing protein
MHRPILSLLVLLFVGKAFCQTGNYIFNHLNTNNGLSSNKVETVLQDKEGFYWIATADGLNRFDGTHCKVFRNDKNDSTSLPNNQCTSLLEDASGNIWVGTNKGFAKYNKLTGRFLRFYLSNGIDGHDALNRINSMCLDDDGNIWVGSFRLAKCNPSTNIVLIIPPSVTTQEDYKKSPFASSIGYDSATKSIWYRSLDGIRSYSILKNEIYRADYNPQQLTVFGKEKRMFFSLANKKLWYYDITSAKLYCLDLVTSSTTYKNTIPLNAVTGMHVEGNNVWLKQTDKNAICYNIVTGKTDSTMFLQKHDKSALSGLLSHIYKDRFNNYWFSSHEGISILNASKQQYEYFSLDEKNSILCAVEPASSQLILATAKGLIFFDASTGQQQPLLIPVLNNKVIKTLEMFNDTLIIGCDRQLVYYDWKEKKVVHSLQIDGTPQFIIVQQPNTWIGTWGRGLYRLKGNQLQHFTSDTLPQFSIAKKSLVCGTATPSGKLLIGHNGGGGYSAFDFNHEQFNNYKIKVSEQLQQTVSNTVTALLEEDAGNLWIGTYGGGLYHFDAKKKSYTMYLQSDGLASNFINKLFVANGSLWVSTSNGINYIELSTKRIGAVDINFVFPSDDVANSGIKTKDGKLYFFCSNKFIRLDPSLSFQTYEQALLVSNFKVLDKEVAISPNQTLQLDYKENFISFDFSVPKTNTAATVKYAYMLQGLNNDWVYTTVPSANYTNLPSDDYILLIKAMDAQGNWMQPYSLQIKIHPPFWQTWWFYCIVGIIIVGITYAVFKYRINQLKKMISVRTKISQDLHDEVGATLSGIALYSHLSQNQMKQQQTEQLGQSLSVIQKSASEMVTKLNDIVWAVNPKHDTLSGLLQKLEEYAMEMATIKNIAVEVTGSELVQSIKLPMDARKNIYLIFKEAINNSVKYSGCSSINLDVQVVGYQLSIIESDNGNGFDKVNAKKGNGLMNMQERAKEIAGLLQIESNEKGTSIMLQCKIPQ